jgi:D-lactate dehydrogenase
MDDRIAPYVTNLDRDVFALRNLPEEVVAVLFAYYSRSRDDLRTNLRRLLDDRELALLDGAAPALPSLAAAQEKARAFHERWVVGYGHASVAEHAVALLMTLNRRIHRAYNRTRENNFSLEGLQGHDIHGKTVGLIGTGRIGALFARIMAGFGATLLGYDVAPNPDCLALGMTYVPLDELLARSDVISLHVPLLPSTHHIINRDAVARMKRGVMLINTSRGKLVDTEAVIDGLKSGQLGAVGLDVYEEEDGLFFRDRSDQILADDEFARLVSFPNALVTGHQAFFTHEALNEIAATTIQNLTDFETGTDNRNILKPK